MSQRALLRACEARLRAKLGDPDGRVAGVQPAPGKPPAKYGDWYYAVVGAGVTGDDPNALSRDQLHSVQVVITAKLGKVPADKRGDRITLEGEIYDRAEQVADWLGMSYATMAAANALIPGFGETTNGFSEPLKFQDITDPVEAPGEWTGGEAAGVYVCTVSLVHARRVRPLPAPDEE